jgi:hypothetical protein
MQTIIIVETVGIFHVVGSLARPSRVEVDELVMLRAAAEEQGWTLAEIHKTPTQWKAMQAR